MAFAFISRDGWDDYQIVLSNGSFRSIYGSFKNTVNFSEDDLSGRILKLKTKTEKLFAITDSGSPMSFLNEKTARLLQDKDKLALF